MLHGLLLLSGFLISPVLFASDSVDVTKSLAGSTALELSGNAANLVASAAPAQRNDVAVAVVRTAVGMNPGAVVAIVSAVVREDPASAPAVAVSATVLQPRRVGLIAKAAVAAAPAQAAKVVAALIKQFPQNYGIIAAAAAEGAPLSGREILAAVGESIPALKAPIQDLSSHFAANTSLPVQTVLSQSYDQAINAGATVALLTSIDSAAGASSVAKPVAYAPAAPTAPLSLPTVSGPSVSGPILGPPFTGSNPSPTTYSPSQTTVEQSGGRNYASP